MQQYIKFERTKARLEVSIPRLVSKETNGHLYHHPKVVANTVARILVYPVRHAMYDYILSVLHFTIHIDYRLMKL